MPENRAPFRIVLAAIALAMFLVAAFAWPAPIEPYRVRFVGAGLFFWLLSTFF